MESTIPLLQPVFRPPSFKFMVAMQNLSPTAGNMATAHRQSIKFSSLYIDMDLATHQCSSSCEVGKVPDPLANSHDNLEFAISHMREQDKSSHIQPVEVPSANKRSLRGPALTLQHNPKPQALHQPKSACPEPKEVYVELPVHARPLNRPHREYSSSQTLNHGQDWSFELTSKWSVGGHDLEKHINESKDLTSTIPPQCSANQSRLLGSSSMRCAKADHPSAGLNGTDLMQLCTLNSEFDLFSHDFSRIRSHDCNTCHWNSTEKDSRDSRSSSRCSNGRFQDAVYFQLMEEKDLRGMSMQSKASHPSIPSSCAINWSQLHVINDESNVRSGHPNHISHIIYSKAARVLWLASRRWSWKGLLAGLRKASKLWTDDNGSGDISEGHNREISSFKEFLNALGNAGNGPRRGAGYDREWPCDAHGFVSREGSITKPNQASKGRGTLGVRDDGRDHQVAAIYCLRSGGRQELRFDGGEAVVKTEKEGKSQNNAWNAKESWSKWMKKVNLGMKLSAATARKPVPLKEMEGNRDTGAKGGMAGGGDIVNHRRGMKAKSVSSTPLVASPVRGAEAEILNMASLNGGYVGSVGSGWFQESDWGLEAASRKLRRCTRKKQVGFTATSCPASIGSSPRNSGILCAVDDLTGSDLHSAIQGAIAHCKQSQGVDATIPSKTLPSAPP